MKVLALLLLATASSSLGAKLEGLSIGSQLAGYSYDAPVAPAVPSGLYELPGPPPPPIIPTRRPTTTQRPTTRRTTPRRTTPRRTTTTTTPPPPVNLYETPEIDPSGGAANQFDQFVTPSRPLETPKPPPRRISPATRTTPAGFSPPPPPSPPKKMMGPYMPYEINWGVQDDEYGNMFSHSEVSEGNDVQGEYRVLLPDGRTQVVTFYADPVNGYNADVTYV